MYRFDAYELDDRSGELTRHRRRIRLRPQPAQALVYLVERHGQFVSRDELRRALWPDGTHVHFDQGLNSCIKQIRAALADTRRTPRFLETLTRRGYRFIAAVSRSEPVATTAVTERDEIDALADRILAAMTPAVRAAVRAAFSDARIHPFEFGRLPSPHNSDRDLTARGRVLTADPRATGRRHWNQDVGAADPYQPDITKES